MIWEYGFQEIARPPEPEKPAATPIIAVEPAVVATDSRSDDKPSNSTDLAPPRTTRRVAFVAGNGAYKNAAQLEDTLFDARATASALRDIGFDVVEGTNLTRDAMAGKLDEFGKKAQGADVAVFFYAGHGMAVDGVNYLLPVDADIKSVRDVTSGTALNVNLALDQTMGDAKVKLVFLDASRDNPFAAKIKSTATRSASVESGLAEMKSSEGELIALATAPGQIAFDGPGNTSSPFTRALIEHITKPGVEISQAMTEVRAQVSAETNRNQLPWVHANLIGSLYLNPAGSGMTTALTSAQAELEFWRSIRNSDKAEELNAYLSAYPNGQFKGLAQARLAAIQNGPPTTSSDVNASIDPATFTDDASQLTEDQIGLDKGQRRDVQRRLNGLGFDTKPNGTFNDEFRSALKRWQTARGYPSSGYFNRLQYKALLAEIVASTSPSASNSSDKGPTRGATGGGGGHRGAGAGSSGTFLGGATGGMFRH
ncbi:caspase family protein [Bradyrhizobium commune]|uniref:Caspase family protein n=2 Tax=Bradyrhizobium commune TaxID=83627 RepID=A0A7S9DE68_9BRAD|nr:caspase family protein [Bradyrhizobium commune]